MSMEEYVQARAAFEAATDERSSVIARLSNIVKSLEHSPELFQFTNCTGGFPIEVATNRAAPTANATEWPSAQQIQDILVRWHNAKFEAENAWSRLTPDQQKAMQPPTKFYDPPTKSYARC
jgi:hypothetical protein